MTDIPNPRFDDADQKLDRARDDQAERFAAAVEVAEADYDFDLFIRAQIANDKLIDESHNALSVGAAVIEKRRLQGDYPPKIDRLNAAKKRWAEVRARP